MGTTRHLLGGAGERATRAGSLGGHLPGARHHHRRHHGRPDRRSDGPVRRHTTGGNRRPSRRVPAEDHAQRDRVHHIRGGGDRGRALLRTGDAGEAQRIRGPEGHRHAQPEAGGGDLRPGAHRLRRGLRLRPRPLQGRGPAAALHRPRPVPRRDRHRPPRRRPLHGVPWSHLQFPTSHPNRSRQCPRRSGMTSKALEVEGLTKIYGEGHTAVTAVSEASLDLAGNEFVGLLGPSGSGKTTLISMIGALLTPTDGSVRIGGEDISGMSKKEQTRFRANRIGFVFQSFNLVPFLTARENLTVMANVSDLSKKEIGDRADQLLEELGLADRRDNLPEQLSGGERQRVAIERALVTDPDLILVDEPTASLDTELGKAVVEMLAKEIKERNKAGIMVTHDLRMVEYTDRTIEIVDGRLRI